VGGRIPSQGASHYSLWYRPQHSTQGL